MDSFASEGSAIGDSCEPSMKDVTRAIQALQNGEPHASDELVKLVYNQLRTLAVGHLRHERPGQTLQATALVNEAYLRLMSGEQAFDSRAHFFAAASEAMRRILIDKARRKAALKRGGHAKRQSLDDLEIAAPETGGVDLLDLDVALEHLAQADADAAKLVKLRFFAGLTTEQAAEVMKMSPRSAYYLWTYARTWLHRELSPEGSSTADSG
jgi:RNA polymerase sigma factor (TIGR02999 family)